MSIVARRRRRVSSGFTLIELLTVMAIIIILAGLILGTAGYANRRAASSRAQAEIKALEAAINSYQVDNGSVPRDKDTTDKLDARLNATQTGVPDTTYQKSSLFLFKALSGYYDIATSTTNPVLNQKAYFPFKGNQLYPSSATAASGSINPASVLYVVDPYGLSYGYSTIGAAVTEANNASGAAASSPPATQQGFNPVFDLWSTSGYGTGRPYPTNTSDKSIFWISNWSGQ